MSPERLERIRHRALELVEKIKFDVLPEHRRRCEEKEKFHSNKISFDDEIMRVFNSNSLVAELKRLQKICPHDFTDFQGDNTWSVPAMTQRCRICRSTETVFNSAGRLS